MAENLPARVVMISLGGTIAILPSPDITGDATVRLTSKDLLIEVIARSIGDVELSSRDFPPVPSAQFRFTDLFALHDAINEEIANGATGIVVTQGTDSLEETSFFIDLLHAGEVPVVFTGAMRHAGLLSADGPANMAASIAVAADAQCRALGVVVVFNDEIHAARDVRKTHSTSLATFASPNCGPLGYVSEGSVQLFRRPLERVHVEGVDRVRRAYVPFYQSLLDDGAGEWLPTLAANADGLVVAAFGAGHVSLEAADVLGELAQHMPVVLCSRTGSGASLSNTYSYRGSESDLLSRGVIRGGYLHPYKARVLLQLLVRSNANVEQIREMFKHAGNY